MFKNVCLGLATTVVFAGTAGASTLASYSTDFENFALGATTPQANGTPIVDDPDGTANWRGDGLTGLGGQGDYDAEIVDTGTPNGQALRISNPDDAATGNYDQTHPSTPALAQAGESGTGAPNQIFNFGFDFLAASPNPQAGFQLDVTPFESGTASRHGIFRIFEGGAGGGLSAGWWDIDGTFRFTPLASNLARDEWHSVSVDMLFNDGLLNDEVSVTLNGSTSTFNSWEAYYAGLSLPLAPVDSVIFRVSTGGGIDGEGVFIDNFSSQSQALAPIPLPAGLPLLAAALGILAAYRRFSRV